MVCTVRRWGNSLAIRLPRTVTAEAALTDGSPVTIKAANGIITIEKLEAWPAYRLEELVRGITPQNRHKSIDASYPVGREVW